MSGLQIHVRFAHISSPRKLADSTNLAQSPATQREHSCNIPEHLGYALLYTLGQHQAAAEVAEAIQAMGKIPQITTS